MSESLSIVTQKKSNMSFVKVFEQDPADAERLIAREIKVTRPAIPVLVSNHLKVPTSTTDVSR